MSILISIIINQRRHIVRQRTTLSQNSQSQYRAVKNENEPSVTDTDIEINMVTLGEENNVKFKSKNAFFDLKKRHLVLKRTSSTDEPFWELSS